MEVLGPPHEAEVAVAPPVDLPGEREVAVRRVRDLVLPVRVDVGPASARRRVNTNSTRPSLTTRMTWCRLSISISSVGSAGSGGGPDIPTRRVGASGGRFGVGDPEGSRLGDDDALGDGPAEGDGDSLGVGSVLGSVVGEGEPEASAACRDARAVPLARIHRVRPCHSGSGADRFSDRMSTDTATAERSTGPPPAGAARPADHFRALVGVLIAMVSILGAIVVWRASAESSNASDQTQRGIQQLILQQQRRGSIESGVARDFRLFTDYQQHVMAWRLLLADADRVQPTDAALANTFRTRARKEAALARGIRPLIQPFNRPGFGDATGVVEFAPGAAADALEDADLELTGLTPSAAFDEANSTHAMALDLVGDAVLFAAALLFLTFAQVARRGARGIFAGAGVVAMVVAAVLFAVIQVAG